MLIIGLAGGVASGKSFVAGVFRQLGAEVLDADLLGHEVLMREDVIAQVSEVFGPEVLRGDGQLNRKAIAAVVFGASSESQQNLEKLEQIVHPPISDLIRKRIESLRERQVPAVILDAPVMFKAGWDQFCDKVVFVEASRKLRLERALARGWTEQHFADRESSQTPISVKRQKATDVVDNNESENTNQQIIELWKEWNLPFPDQHDVPTNA